MNKVSIVREFLTSVTDRGLGLAVDAIDSDPVEFLSNEDVEEELLAFCEASPKDTSEEELIQLRGEVSKLRHIINKTRRDAAALDRKRKRDICFALGFSKVEDPEDTWDEPRWNRVLNQIVGHRSRDVSRKSLREEVSSLQKRLHEAEEVIVAKRSQYRAEAATKDSLIGRLYQELESLKAKR
jgi:hypothetical protein